MSLEQSITSNLRAVLAPLSVGARIVNSEKFQQVLGALEFYIPQVLRELHPEWKYESLDGVFSVATKKTAPNEIELIGECILISDQAIIPVHLRMQLAYDADVICWLECRLGERMGRTMKRNRHGDDSISRILKATVEEGAFDWYYSVTFGHTQHL